MALSDIIINELVQEQTQRFIRNTNYTLLRHYLLTPKSLVPVSDSIHVQLTQQYNADKQALKHYLIRLACDAQEEEDENAALQDDKEQIHHELQYSLYTHNHLNLQNQLATLDKEQEELQLQCSQLQRAVQELNVKLEQQTMQLHRCRNKSRSLSFGHATINDSLFTAQLGINASEEQESMNKLLLEEDNLLEASQELNFLLDIKNIELMNTERHLQRLIKKRTTLEQQDKAIEHELVNVLLPQKQQRQFRAQERATRAEARKAYDPDLLQLASKNYTMLEQDIAQQTQELDVIRNELMDKATALSYPTYLRLLDQTLQDYTLQQINYNEHRVLTTILKMMNQLPAIAEQEQITLTTLNREPENLQVLQQKLQERLNGLHQAHSSEYLLTQENEDLTAKNAQLQRKSASAQSYRKNALYGFLFGMSSTLLSTGLISSLFIAPLLIALPGSFSLIIVTSLTVALIAHWKYVVYEAQIEKNKEIIGKNDIILNDLATLREKINQSEQQVLNLEHQLTEQRYAREHVLREASSIYTGSTTFFGENIRDNFPLVEDDYAQSLGMTQ